MDGIGQRADLVPVYAMIFSRLKAVGADWIYHFPELGVVQSAVAELDAQRRHAEIQKFRTWLCG